MRHRVDHRKLGRTASHRKAMLRNMVTSLFAAERITTTDAKAKEARRLAERLITRAKKGYAAHQDGNKDVALAHWRQASRFIRKTEVLRKLFEEIAPHYLEREGGYTRIIRLEPRLGDNAKTVMLELVDTKVTSKPKTKAAAGEEAEESKGDKKKKAEADDKKKKKTEADDKKKTKAKAKGKTKSKGKAKAKGKTKAKSKASDANEE
jgi:large subunit ribosomal protein L17